MHAIKWKLSANHQLRIPLTLKATKRRESTGLPGTIMPRIDPQFDAQAVSKTKIWVSTNCQFGANQHFAKYLNKRDK